MTEPRHQYVGIAATTSIEEIYKLQEILRLVRWPESVWFMNGPLVSRKTLVGEPPSNPAQYPQISQVADLMVSDDRFFNVVHFNSRDPRLCQQLNQIMQFIPRAQGIQLNISWPEPGQLTEFRQVYPQPNLILQVSRFAYREAGGSPARLIQRLKPYEGLVDYVLFDPSGGEGISFDLVEAVSVLEAEVDSGLDFGWGVTGGLDADRVYRLQELLDIYPQLCWDAQSRLRSGDEQDTLSIARCFEFLAESSRLLKQYQ
ncbi:hypothetical protein EPO04_02645 [Patescibacteria group bacterium]|nr:MAG: hypothetical protein EPO04_02645 [Patescibacteria group bacterium]